MDWKSGMRVAADDVYTLFSVLPTRCDWTILKAACEE